MCMYIFLCIYIFIYIFHTHKKTNQNIAVCFLNVKTVKDKQRNYLNSS